MIAPSDLIHGEGVAQWAQGAPRLQGLDGRHGNVDSDNAGEGLVALQSQIKSLFNNAYPVIITKLTWAEMLNTGSVKVVIIPRP